MRVMVMVVSILFAAGCSVVTMTKPKSSVATSAECTSSRLAPVVDTSIVLAHVAAIAVAAFALDGGEDAQNAVIGSALISGVVWTASAGNGYEWAGDCRKLRSETKATANR